jgi:hypothetical protein
MSAAYKSPADPGINETILSANYNNGRETNLDRMQYKVRFCQSKRRVDLYLGQKLNGLLPTYRCKRTDRRAVRV